MLSKTLDRIIINADYQIKSLQGGTVGDVQLVSGIAETDNGEKTPYKIVLKTQKKWERSGDPNSWRREYDLYMSKLDALFTDSLRWPECYHAEINEEETQTQLWLEYIDGISGWDLTIEMLEKAAFELGRFQGRLYKNKPDMLHNMDCFGEFDAVRKYYMLCRGEMLKRIDSLGDELPRHLRQLLIDCDDKAEEIFSNAERLPIVLCHRDFWVTNIFYKDGKIILIDWDTTGWGFMGEDAVHLIFDETDINCLVEYYSKLLPAYLKGIAGYIDVSKIDVSHIWEVIVLKYGETYVYQMISKSHEERSEAIAALQKIYDMKNIKLL
ncbi:MAG: aminoglycoside phosphotransferase family protein [Oscillospiraceae bacterium]|nr:aminoglycoside phosphotransferase family protein [Oscillospiraceae bacterium]